MSAAHNASPSLSRHALFGGGLSAEFPANLIDARCVIQVGRLRRCTKRGRVPELEQDVANLLD